MSQIDIQNAKQIRDPMTVLISMEVPEDVAVTYSVFTNVKIEDAQLGQRAWPMRQLADLQGDGFALDGSRSLYDPSVTASAANGKIGVRGDVGEDVTFTVSGDSDINGLSLAATGTDRVLFNGQTATFSDGQVIVPVGSDSITLTFPAAETDRRVEVSFTLPGTSLKVTNDSIISCIVSLRSDLSIEDPTLPESELNVEIYNDVDISEAVASIPDDSPLIYSAGYPGDMSPDRKFYVAGQITWADNVLSIHAVDAVHFLDVEPEPATVNSYNDGRNRTTPTTFVGLLSKYLNDAGIDIRPETWYYVPPYSDGTATAICMIPRCNLRELMAFVNNVFKVEGIDTAQTTYRTEPITHSFWAEYVDAGIPSLKTFKPEPKWVLYEEDTSDIKKNIEPKINNIQVIHSECIQTQYSGGPVGSVTWKKDGPAYVSIEKNVGRMLVQYSRSNYEEPFVIDGKKLRTVNLLPMTAAGVPRADPWVTVNVKIRARYRPGSNIISIPWTGQLIDGESLQNIQTYQDGVIYTQVIPENAPFARNEWLYWHSMSEAWSKLQKAGIINDSDEETTFDIIGTAVITSEENLSYHSETDGRSITIEEIIKGTLNIYDNQKNFYMELFPNAAYESLLQRSNITGSFTWKGDPRMQPRDVVEFHRLDGTVEEITLENITLHHEGGGTYAEITYRKGVC